MDVLTDYASTVRLPGEEECTVQLLEHLGVKRRKYAMKLYKEVRGLRSSLRKDLRRTANTITELVPANGANSHENAIAPKAAGSAVTLAVQLAEPPRLDKGNLHPYRLKVKELRNVLEMAPDAKTGFIDDLSKVKDAIGEWHDWEELVSIAQKKLDHGSRCALVAELKRIAGRKYDHALALADGLRRTYLQSSDLTKRPSSKALPKIPRGPVWDSIARLAA